jgi:sorting nexin-9/18/33
MSQAERLLSYSLLSLISCKPLSSESTTGISGEEDEANDQAKGLVNSDNAWCWREGCEGERMTYHTYRAH